ncbi:ABC transporter G family member 9 [Rhizoctonia solani]|uniref:ABC transporter G family member 9 n=1 Tax=Rhizoctonia solani TaxID=456999 RepID=A0A0K6FKS0_9AGAM|nr:ABC transporter G family member 9 [Rhizoctonia solani]
MRLSGVLIAACSLASAASAFKWSQTKTVLAFGDSYTFVQGTMGHPGYSFFGDRFNLTITKDVVLKSEIVGNATSSGGANWIEMITNCYAGLPAKCPRTLWNFAFAGADIDPAILALHHDYTVDMTEQVDQWVQAWKNKLLKAPTKSSLAAFFIGINDTGDTSGWKNITDWTAFWNTEMDSYFKAVGRVYDTGLRSFLFLNVPDRTGSNPQIATFNSLLAQRVDAFKASKKDVSTVLFDTSKLFVDVLANATAYGFTNTTGYCRCTDPGYFWYILTAIALAEGAKWSEIKTVLAFGDSYTSVGGTTGLLGYSFFGDGRNLTITAEEVQKGEFIANQTSSGGSNWIQMITGCYEGHPSDCPRILWDFAWAGATIDANIVPLESEVIIPLTDQAVQWAQARNDNLLEAPGSSSLAAFFIGINDMLGTTSWKNVTDWDAFWNKALDSYFKAVDQVYDTGLRSFLFLNVPNLSRSPGLVDNPDVANHATQVKTFNSLLEQRIKCFKASKYGVSVASFDIDKLMNGVLDNPGGFGFTNTTGFCGRTDPGYFWRDPYHPTEGVHRLVANGILSELEKLE